MNTGMRKGEVLSLKWSQIRNGFIYLTKTKTNEEFCKMVYDSIQAGGSGIAAGRNVFQHEHPPKMIRVLSGIVHEDLEVEATLRKYMK